MKYKAVIFDLFGTLVDIFLIENYRRMLAGMAAGDGHELTGARQMGMEAALIRVSDEDPATAYRLLEDDWDGPRISSLLEVLRLVDIGDA